MSKCGSCGKDIDLFPGYLLAGDARHPKNVFVCSACGELTESDNRKAPGKCIHCNGLLKTEGPAKRNQCLCPYCGRLQRFPQSSLGAPRHRLFALEYHCFQCKKKHDGRFFKKADKEALAKVKETEQAIRKMHPKYVPDDDIPSGDETDRLHRWGYRKYREMFNSRQLLSLELSARFISGVKEDRLKRALMTNLSDLLRYQNMLCRYDTMALKSLDIFSVHGFPVGLIQCESNFLGIVNKQREACIGSGGWANIIEKYRKAKLYCEEPFEIRHNGRAKEVDQDIRENGSEIASTAISQVRDAKFRSIAPIQPRRNSPPTAWMRCSLIHRISEMSSTRSLWTSAMPGCAGWVPSLLPFSIGQRHEIKPSSQAMRTWAEGWSILPRGSRRLFKE